MSAPTGLTIKNSLASMSIGDCIPCRYTAATSGTAGAFSELGTCTAAEIPVAGSATPNGLFYFIKADKGLLIADRVLQHSISWDVLNTAKFIHGNPYLAGLATIPNNEITATKSGGGSGVINGTTSPQKLFNGVVTNNSSSEGLYMYGLNAPLQISFTLQNPAKLYKLRYYPYSGTEYQPYTFTIEASNDTTNGVNGSWSVLKTYTALAPVPASSWGELIIDSPIAYKAYRYNISKFGFNGTDNQFLLNEIELIVCTESTILAIIRSLAGGNIYLGANGLASIADAGLGAWPPNNEWDTYVVKSTLGSKITSGDNNVWHWNNAIYGCFTCDTPIISLIASTNRVLRGCDASTGLNRLNGFTWAASSGTNANYGFRPVLEYPEDIHCTNVWY